MHFGLRTCHRLPNSPSRTRASTGSATTGRACSRCSRRKAHCQVTVNVNCKDNRHRELAYGGSILDANTGGRVPVTQGLHEPKRGGRVMVGPVQAQWLVAVEKEMQKKRGRRWALAKMHPRKR